MKKVIGITGLAGSGKDTVAMMIRNAIPEVETISFAKPLKEFAEAIFLFPTMWLYGASDYRNLVLTPDSLALHKDQRGTAYTYWSNCLARFWALGGAFHREWLEACGRTVGGSNGASAFVDWFDSIRRECERDPSKLTPRHVLQQLGSDFGRKHIHPDVWSNVAWHRINKSTGRVFVIPDVRFDNEAQPILNAGGQVWHVVRHQTKTGRLSATHVSEKGIDHKFVTATFPNFGSLDSLRDRVRDELYYMGLT